MTSPGSHSPRQAGAVVPVSSPVVGSPVVVVPGSGSPVVVRAGASVVASDEVEAVEVVVEVAEVGEPVRTAPSSVKQPGTRHSAADANRRQRTDIGGCYAQESWVGAGRRVPGCAARNSVSAVVEVRTPVEGSAVEGRRPAARPRSGCA